MRKANKVIFMRVTEEEYHKVKLSADQFDLTVTDYFKALAFGPKKMPTSNMGLKAKSLKAA